MVKETKLYELLGVTPGASDADIKKGYRKAALKYHPDKPTGDTEKFKEVSEAFEILSNEEKKEVYDQYGLEAARGNAPAGGAGGNPFGGAGGAGGFSGFSGHGQGGFSSQDAFNIFSQFGGMGGGMGGGDDPFGGMGGGFGGGYGGQPRRREPEIHTINLPVSLEDLFAGTTKKLKINRKGPSGAPEAKVISVTVRPGWKAGTKLSYAGEGDYQSDGQRQTIQFVIQEKDHPVFKRDGNDLKVSVPVSFKESLLGFSKEITTIDGRRIPVLRTQPLQPNTAETYPGLGMPISKTPTQRGNLIISYKIDFPVSLTQDQKAAISQCF
ncbi:hypothetical protein BABINDRAFT_162528 [Babjeviella inositovora NRRL Y-12698]|uniref:J domain-containing protein n=1 Tax=Babjeviella inositovora NRRL Y-12698 TaxID=984486 RepID=A0A1E3QMF1_9ASCO|nr:uncharacterized protein BABINDRAFT_162528 [Babjeviella inositovora NRRL Y-12698]ODQ78851.1 hypothetical protein BABINDRAFT_162528 [Babjeviella inositovora NRRL Y-12698]